MKVLHIVPAIDKENGGPVRALIGYVNCVRNKVQIEVATTSCGLRSGELEKVKQEVGNIPVHCFRQFGRHSWNISWEMSEWLRKNIGSYDLAHIHALFSPMSTIAAFWARKRKVPYVLKPMGTLSSYTFSRCNQTLKRLYFTLFEKRTVEGAAAIHFTSPLEMQKLQPICHLPNPVVIPNAIEPIERDGRRNGLGRGTLKILYLSRIDPKKGLDLLIPAIKQLIPHCDKKIDLTIAGSGERNFVARLIHWVKKEGIQNCVRFPGFTEGKSKLRILEESDLFVLPSYDENFGISVAEAMMAGMPVIVSDQVGVARDVEEYEAGVVVPCNSQSLQAGLEKLINDPKLCLRMGQQGQLLVREKYSPERVGASLFSLYSKIVSR